MNIYFFNEDAQPPAFLKKIVREIAKKIALEEQKNIKSVNIIFCSDNYLLEINKEYLNHDYFTDIITFDYAQDNQITSDIFISVDRIVENASLIKVTVLQELYRIIIHGLLHLCGYEDDTNDKRYNMSLREDYYLSLIK